MNYGGFGEFGEIVTYLAVTATKLGVACLVVQLF